MTTTIKLFNKALIEAIKIAKTFNSEGNITFNSEGILINNIDEANVCFNSILIKKENFINFDFAEEVNICVNFDEMYNLIKSHKSEVILKLLDNAEYINNERDTIYLEFEGFKSELKLSDCEKSSPNIPNLEHKINFEVDSKNLKTIIKNLCNVSDCVKFNIDILTPHNPKEELLTTLNLSSKNQIGTKSETNILIQNIERNGEDVITSLFSLEYLEKYFKTIISPEIKIFLSADYPILIIQENREIKHKFILAPRINNEEFP